MTNSDLTLIAALLDRSGSMATSKAATEDGWRELINAQRQEPGECRVTLAQFDDRYDIVYSPTAIADLPEFVLEPRGMTAMLDAVGKFITDVGVSLAVTAEDNRPGQVICLIMTDGHENASHEWTWDKIKELIKNQQDQWNWKFIFLGANIDAVSVADDMGIPMASAMTYNAGSGQAVMDSFAVAAASMTSTRSGLVDAFTDEDRAKAMGKQSKATSKK